MDNRHTLAAHRHLAGILTHSRGRDTAMSTSGQDWRELAEKFTQATGVRFHNPALLAQALTHSDDAGIGRPGAAQARDYERLEFLGDRVLGLVVAEELFRRYPQEGEGLLARRLNQLVRRETCAEVARRLGLHEMMITAKTAERRQVQASQKVLADLCESVIAAIYLDQGLEAARNFIISHWQELFARHADAPRDAKSALQEWAAARRLPPPAYREVTRSGPDHAPLFTVAVAVEGLGEARGQGPSKRTAEQDAAGNLLRKAENSDG